MCSNTFYAICARQIYVAPSEQTRWNEYPPLNKDDISKILDTGRTSPLRKEIRSCSTLYSGILQSSLDIEEVGLQRPENYF
jgi:hypothetical protein